MTESRGMKPILHFAAFIEHLEKVEGSLNIYGIHNRVMVATYGDAKGKTGWGWVDLTLAVGVIADEGPHELLIKHANTDWTHRTPFIIQPEHGQTFTQLIKRSFPVLIPDQPSLNEYRLLLDLEPLGNAYLISHPM